MRKLVVLFALLVAVGTFSAGAQAQVNNLNEPGSILVYPLIDNINYTTIVDMANRNVTDVWLAGFIILHPPGLYDEFEKKDFVIHLTQKEPFWWDTSKPYYREDRDEIITAIPGFDNLKGFMFVWAVDNDKSRLEIDWDYLKGDAIIYGGGRAFQYNAIPHQGLAVVGDRVLNLDGNEYTMATSQVMFEGLAGNFIPGLCGVFVVASLDIDFILSLQPEFDINFNIWNQDEVFQSRHKHFYQFYQYDLVDLQLLISQVFTPKFQAATTSTHALWAIFYQTQGVYAWGTNVFQHPDTGVPTTVVLPPVPL
jgi:hypothetical protein